MNNRKPKPIIHDGVEFPSMHAFARYFFPDDALAQKRCRSRLLAGWDSTSAASGRIRKKCKQCGNYYFSKNKAKIYCSDNCRTKHSHQKDTYKQKQKSRYAENKQQLRAQAKKRMRDVYKKPEYKKYIKDRRLKQREELHDDYIIRLLNRDRKLNGIKIPTQLIQLKREQLKLKRQIGEIENEECK